MAAKPKDAKKVRIDYNIDKEIYDDFVRLVSRKGFVPTVVVQIMMKKFIDSNGQM